MPDSDMEFAEWRLAFLVLLGLLSVRFGGSQPRMRVVASSFVTKRLNAVRGARSPVTSKIPSR